MIRIGSFRRLANLGTLLLVCVAGSVGCQPLAGRVHPTPLSGIPARELLIDDRAFPDAWDVDPCAPVCDRAEGDRKAGRTFGIVGVAGHALQDVYRLPSIADAQAMFQRSREVDFRRSGPPRQPSSELVPPSEFHYRSPIADEYYFGCGVDVNPVCQVSARYRQYFVEFFFDVDRGIADGVVIVEDGLKIIEVEPILQALDEHVALRLGIPWPPPTATPNT